MPASLSSHQQHINPHTHKQSEGLCAVPPSADKPHLHLVVPEGQLQVHTAPFRGSFSGVLSEALRAAGLGSNVLIAQFLKGGVGQGPKGIIKFCGHLEWLRPDVPYCITEKAEEGITKTNQCKGKKAVEAIWENCKEKLSSGDLDQLVLDEVGLAISLGYLKEKELISTLEQRPAAMDVILTGPAIPSQVIGMADQVTKLRSYF